MKKFVALALILAGVVLFQFASDFENAFSEPPPAVEEPLPGWRSTASCTWLGLGTTFKYVCAVEQA